MTYLPDDLYKTLTNSIPIVCIDVIPIRCIDDRWQIGIITRATGSQKGLPALLGGRIQYGETISEAITRHLLTDWRIEKFSFSRLNDQAHPFYVQQYKHDPKAEPPFGYDPSKHAIGLTYLIEITETPHPQKEAQAFYWTDSTSIPVSAAYNQNLLMIEALERVTMTLSLS